MFKIEKASPEEFNARKRVSWPFKDMSVGDVVRIDDPELASKAQIVCHAHGKHAGMKFKTKTTYGVLNIYRVQ